MKTQLDPIMKSGVKAIDWDLSRIQTLVLDTFTPLSTLLDNISPQEATDALATAVELPGNANVHISCLTLCTPNALFAYHN